MLSKLKIKYIQSLGQKKFRDEEGMFIAESPHCVEEFIRSSPGQLTELFATREWMDRGISLPAGVQVIEVTQEELKRISRLNTPNEVLALARKFEPGALPDPSGTLVLALDSIQDPGNLGTIIRIADWFGLPALVCNTGTADIYNSKTVQATMGSLARVRVHYTSLVDWLSLWAGARVYASVMEGQDLRKVGKLSSGVMLIGNEARGLSDSLLARANVRITIPRLGEAESLNAAVAAGIILSHTC